MFEYKVDLIAKKILKLEDYLIFRYKYGIMSKWLKKRALYFAPYVLNNNKTSNTRYIIFRGSPEMGGAFLSYIKKTIFAAEWALENGYYPIFDIEHLNCFSCGKIGENNQFEYCFKNIKDIKEIIDKENVFVYALDEILANRDMCIDINGSEDATIMLKDNDGWRTYYHRAKIYFDKWLIFTEDYKEYLDNYIFNKLTSERCLGVFIRDTFHMDIIDKLTNERVIKLHQKHPASDYIENIICDVSSFMEKWECKKIFIATICADTLNQFKEKFGNDLIYVERQRTARNKIIEDLNRDDQKGTLANIDYIDECDRIRSYVGEVLYLSRCDCLMATKAGGAVMSLVFNGGEYENIHLFDDLNKTNIY